MTSVVESGVADYALFFEDDGPATKAVEAINKRRGICAKIATDQHPDVNPVT